MLMSVYRDIAFLPSAVHSILQQTFRDFEFLIVDDVSTDGSTDFLTHLQDPRVRLCRNDQNLGLTRSLQLGLALARGHFVARMDADDIATPDRLFKQITYLEQHPAIGILGSVSQKIDAQGRPCGLYHVPMSDLHVRWTSLFANPFVHSTVMIRRAVLIEHHLNYDENYLTAQDYELWTRVLRYTQGANLPDRLVQYRVHGSLTRMHREAQLSNHDAIALRTIRVELPDFVITPEQVRDLRAILIGGPTRPGLAERRATLADLYLNMLDVFTSQHPSHPDLVHMQRIEAARVVRFFLRPPLPPGAKRIFKRLTQLTPVWPVTFAANVLKAGASRARYGRAHD